MKEDIRTIDVIIFCCITFFIGLIVSIGFSALQEAKKEGAVTRAEMSEAMQLALRPRDEALQLLIRKMADLNKPSNVNLPSPLKTPNEK